MKLLKYVCILLLVLPLWLNAQTPYLDSLTRELNNATTPNEKMYILRLIASDEPDSEKRIAYANQLKDLAVAHDNFFFHHAAELQLGIAYRFRGDLSRSLFHLLNSLEIAKENDDEKSIGASYGEIAATYASQGDLELAVSYSNKIIELFRQQQDTFNLTIALLNTAYDYYTLDKLDTSLMYGREAEFLAQRFSDIEPERRASLLAYISGNTAITQGALGQKEKAIESLNESIETLKAVSDYYAVADFMKFMGEIQFDLGKVDEAEKNATEALKLAEVYGMSELSRDLNLLLFRINNSRGNAGEALKYHLAYTSLADSLENKNVIREMAKQRSAFELAQKESEVALLKAQRKNQQAVVIIATVVVFAFAILVIVIFIYYRSKIRVNRLLTKQKASLERLNETKDKFFSIISHDLRGPISSLMGVSHLIRHFVEDKDEDQLLKMADHMEMTIEQLTVLLDNLLNWAMQQQGHFPNVPEKVNLNGMGKEIVGMFSNMAAGKKIDLSFQAEEDFMLWVDRNSVHTIIRNLINNAIKFTNEAGEITCELHRNGDFAKLRVIDNGIGIPKDRMNRLFKLSGERSTYGTAGEKGLGLGLQLVYEFVKMNGGTIDVESEENVGTTFTVNLLLFDTEAVQEKVTT